MKQSEHTITLSLSSRPDGAMIDHVFLRREFWMPLAVAWSLVAVALAALLTIRSINYTVYQRLLIAPQLITAYFISRMWTHILWPVK